MYGSEGAQRVLTAREVAETLAAEGVRNTKAAYGADLKHLDAFLARRKQKATYNK